MGFWPKLFFQNSCFFSNNSHRRCHRGPFIGRKECIWDLLLKVMNFPTSILGGKPLWGHDFWNFLIPKKCPLYGRFTGVEKNFIRQFEVCEHIELEVQDSTHPGNYTTNIISTQNLYYKIMNIQNRVWV